MSVFSDCFAGFALQNTILTDFKARFLANRMRHYERALELVEPQDVVGSFGLVERARARALLDLLVESRSSMLDGVDEKLRKRERVLLDEVGLATQTWAITGSCCCGWRVIVCPLDPSRIGI